MTNKDTFKELDLSSYDNASENWFALIKEDPLLNGGLSLDTINEEFDAIHKAISHTPLVKKMPALTKIPLIGKLFNTDVAVKLSGFEWKLSSIFIAYDENYNSLINSELLYEQHIESITNKIEKLDAHLLEVPATTDKNKLYINSVKTLVSALTGTLTRMKINLDTAETIRTQMKLNRPIFQTIIESLVIEKTGEIGLTTAQNSINTMNKFLVKTASSMTDRTIAFSKEINANKYSTEVADAFQTNLNKLWVAMQEIVEIKRKAVLANEQRTTLLLTNKDNG